MNDRYSHTPEKEISYCTLKKIEETESRESIGWNRLGGS